MEKGDKNSLKKLYHLNADEVQNESNVEANEMAVIYVKPENQTESVKGIF
ncbi:hypothetical protein E6C60_2732 [Paenibacillus algicola]|uniref:Uncharacterized protein n=1 Tax=Paenibacillus algicola TaxID=2565926 RepID=A0A4V1G448_9BACL|nr:hypothetical protein E6C60_2732 [Paenibacillus algicola]